MSVMQKEHRLCYSLDSLQIKMTQSKMASWPWAEPTGHPDLALRDERDGDGAHSDDSLTLTSDEIHDGMNLELYYQ